MHSEAPAEDITNDIKFKIQRDGALINGSSEAIAVPKPPRMTLDPHK